MNCSLAKRLLSACLDRDLTIEEEEQLRDHLRDCAGCASEMAGLETLQTLLHGLPETQPDPDFYEAVCRRIEAARAVPPVLAGGPRWAWADLVRSALASPWLRPAAGVALGLAAGLMINLGSAPDGGFPLPMASHGLALDAQTAEMMASQPESIRATVPFGVPQQPQPTPFSDIDLAAATSDSTLRNEYVLDPYRTDRDGRPLPMVQSHNVGIIF